MTTRTGTRPLADEMYFILHEDMGRPRLPEHPTGVLLAAALLMELALAEAVHVVFGVVTVRDDRVPDDLLARYVHETLYSCRRPLELHEWLRHLGSSSCAAVAERMKHAGLLVFRSGGRLREPVLVPASAELAAVPESRLQTVVMNREPMTLPDTVLAGLTLASGLAEPLFREVRGFRRCVGPLVEALPRSIHELVAGANFAAGRAGRFGSMQERRRARG